MPRTPRSPRRQFQVGDPHHTTCTHCGRQRIWVKAPPGSVKRDGSPKHWMAGCPEFRKLCPGKTDPKPQPAPEAPKQRPVDPALLAKLVEQKVAEEVAKIDVGGVREIVWKLNDVKVAELKDKRPHKALSQMLLRASAGLQNQMLVGPAGTGKTTLAAQFAESLSLRFASVSCSGGMSEWVLTGRSMPNLTTGESVFQSTEFIDLCENGGVMLLDEADACDPNVLVAVNSLMANGYLNVPARVDKPKAIRHKDFYIVFACNTYGTGGDMVYQGRNALDGATLNRFTGAVIPVDYDRGLEEALVPDPDITLRIWAIRDKVEQLKLRRICGTRELLAVARLHKAGMSLKDAIQSILVGWTEDEKRKIGEVWR